MIGTGTKPQTSADPMEDAPYISNTDGHETEASVDDDDDDDDDGERDLEPDFDPTDHQSDSEQPLPPDPPTPAPRISTRVTRKPN